MVYITIKYVVSDKGKEKKKDKFSSSKIQQRFKALKEAK